MDDDQVRLVHFVVIYRGRECVQIEEFPNETAASIAMNLILDNPNCGLSGSVYSVWPRESLGIKVGDLLPEDLSDEMDFRGFGEDEDEN